VAFRQIASYPERTVQTTRGGTQNNDAAKAVRADLPEQENGRARDKAAEALHVSGRLVEAAAKVKARFEAAARKRLVPELGGWMTAKDVDSGTGNGTAFKAF
jgi:hypothetical protein